MAEIVSEQQHLARVRVGTIGATASERLAIHTALGNAAASRGYRVSSSWTVPATELAPSDERDARIELNTGARIYELLSINFEADLKLTIARMAQIDAALILVDAASGPTPSTREQALLLQRLTVGHDPRTVLPPRSQRL